jgi:arginase family enzyme
MKPEILVADFSGVYEAEDFLRCLQEQGLPVRHVELGEIEGTVCYCDAAAEAEIRRRLAPVADAGIRWIDSGDYHYVTKILAEFQQEPFVLVLMDNHPDDQEPVFGGVLSCGSWVKALRESQPMLHAVWTLGPDHRIRGPKVDRELEEGIDDLLEALEGQRVYLSIDKDVLRREESRTDWSQGSYALETLAGWIRKLMRTNVVAIDLCGEFAPSKGATPEDLWINGETNRYLQELLLDCLK